MGKYSRKYFGIVVLTFFVCTSLLAQQPKVVVGITVDQMKTEYLFRFDKYFTQGFRRLIDNGSIFFNHHYSHVPTYTAPGHATIYTGAQPSEHGIIANDWYNPITREMVYCVSDPSVQPVGTESEAGKMSPRNLLTTTITDELSLSTGGKSYIGAVSLKDRGAILPGGHAADEVFWFSDSDGFISSSYYFNELPEWVQNFNSEHKNLQEYTQKWDYLLDSAAYKFCLNDNNEYETRLAMNGRSDFPYDIPQLIERKGNSIIRTTPFGNSLVADFALNLISNIPKNLSSDEALDFVSISFSSTDYVGHAFGPRSREVMDTYLRLDIDLGRILDALDKKYGKDNYLLFLTADHGVAENPQHLANDLHFHSKSHSGADIMSELNETARKVFGFNPIEKWVNNQIYLNDSSLKAHQLKLEDAYTILSQSINSLDWVHTCLPTHEVSTSIEHAPSFVENGLTKLSGDLTIIMEDNHLIYGKYGSSHGSMYTYDTHVPLIFFGSNISHQTIYEKTEMTQLAPTLSFLLKISLPHSAFNQTLTQLLP